MDLQLVLLLPCCVQISMLFFVTTLMVFSIHLAVLLNDNFVAAESMPASASQYLFEDAAVKNCSCMAQSSEGH